MQTDDVHIETSLSGFYNLINIHVCIFIYYERRCKSRKMGGRCLQPSRGKKVF